MKIITVHGTQLVTGNNTRKPARNQEATGPGENDAAAQWNFKDSPFCKRLIGRVRFDNESPEIDEFGWDGDNDFEIRLKDSRKLAADIVRYEKDGIDYYIVCHSHGGSVCLAALERVFVSRNTLNHLIGISTFGTPFIHHEENFLKVRVWGNSRAYLSLIGLLSLAAIIVGYLTLQGGSVHELLKTGLRDLHAGNFLSTPSVIFFGFGFFAIWISWFYLRRLGILLLRSKARRAIEQLQKSQKMKSFWHLDDEVIWWLGPLDTMTRRLKEIPLNRPHDETAPAEESSIPSTGLEEVSAELVSNYVQQLIKNLILPVFFSTTALTSVLFATFPRGVGGLIANAANLGIIAIGIGLLITTFVIALYLFWPKFSRSDTFKKHALNIVKVRLREIYAKHVLGMKRNFANLSGLLPGWNSGGDPLWLESGHLSFSSSMQTTAASSESDFVHALRNFAIIAHFTSLKDAINELVSSKALLHNCYFDPPEAAALVAHHMSQCDARISINSEAFEAEIGKSEFQKLKAVSCSQPVELETWRNEDSSGH